MKFWRLPILSVPFLLINVSGCGDSARTANSTSAIGQIDSGNYTSNSIGNTVSIPDRAVSNEASEPESLESILAKAQKPQVSLTASTLVAESDSRVPIIILVNHSGHSLTDFTEADIFVDDQLGVMGHGRGTLLNGRQKIIMPYIRYGGTLTVRYEIEGTDMGRSWNSGGPLRPDFPLVLTFQRDGSVTSNPPYKGD